MATLKEIRKFVGMTQKELAEKAGISARQIQRIESGETLLGNTASKIIHEVEKNLGITLEEMESIDLSIFTDSARDSVKSGDVELKDLLEINKYQKAKELSQVGAFGSTFLANYDRIPDSVVGKLTPKETAALVDAFYQAYCDGKEDK